MHENISGRYVAMGPYHIFGFSFSRFDDYIEDAFLAMSSSRRLLRILWCWLRWMLNDPFAEQSEAGAAVIDRMHRLRAAKLNGRSKIEVEFLDGLRTTLSCVRWRQTSRMAFRWPWPNAVYLVLTRSANCGFTGVGESDCGARCGGRCEGRVS